MCATFQHEFSGMLTSSRAGGLQGKAMKMFTSKQAQQCLAGKRIIFAGDSYQMQFFIGLAGKEVAM